MHVKTYVWHPPTPYPTNIVKMRKKLKIKTSFVIFIFMNRKNNKKQKTKNIESPLPQYRGNIFH